MASLATLPLERSAADHLSHVSETLGPRFAERAAHHDASESFVTRNFAELKECGAFKAAVPKELGGAGASLAEAAEFLRRLASCCGSTSLALSMHMHQVFTLAWRWRREGAPVDAFLRRIAKEDIVLVGSGGSDWLHSSGTAIRDGQGYRINARKAFASGVPAGDLLMTSAVYDDPTAGATVLHFPVDLRDQRVRISDTWHVLGMRGTGSHDVAIGDFFVPDSAISVRRPRGKWHPLLHLITMNSLPLICAVYVGLAEAARDKAVQHVRTKTGDLGLPYLVGELENELAAAQVIHRHMVNMASSAEPSPATTNGIAIARTLVGQAAIRTVEKALEVAGGAGYFRKAGLERIFRDMQAVRFHPLQHKAQLRYSGNFAMGASIDDEPQLQPALPPSVIAGLDPRLSG
jgi:acyl-CoA dehydrogenase